jgi:hypothetical protein
VPLAEKYVAASWALQQQAEVGDHLGQIFEKEGHPQDAARLYAQALSAEAPTDDIRDHLRRVAPPGHIDTLIDDNRGELVKSRTLTLNASGPSGKHADFFILIGQPGRVEGVKFVSGDKEMESVGAAIQKLQFASAFPDDQPAKLVRRGIAACTASGCTFTLLLPSDTRAGR